MKIAKLYKKLTLANLLNWFAMRFYRVAQIVTGYIISIAIRLNPSREIFQKNLDSLKLNRVFFFKKVTLPYFSILEGCQNLKARVIFHKEGEIIELTLPKVINKGFKVNEAYACEAKLPDIYLAEISGAQIFAGTDLIVVDKSILYDEIDKNTFNRYAVKSPLISSVSRGNITIKLPLKTINIDQGIHFAKDHSKNYFHWIIECLPRLSLVNERDNNIPLLVDDDLPKQFYEALALLNQDNRKLIKLNSNTVYEIGKLYFPSQLSVVHDNYNNPIYDKDSLYSAKAISYVREAVLKKIASGKNLPSFRKLYISRKNSDYRQVLNSNEIEDILVEKGFEIIFPEHLSFFAQVQLFSQAKLIIGQSGAGMANFIFAPKDCKILMMMSDASQTNLHLFGALTQALGLNLEYIIGKSIVVRKKYSIHADFYIDIKLLIDFLDKEGLL